MDHATQTRIDGIISRAIQGIRDTKGKEYASEEDTLADFKEVAAEAGITPLQCWATYVKKHERAIDTFIREGAVKSESIEGRILDVIVYHHLLLGLIADAEEWSHVLGEIIDPWPRESTRVVAAHDAAPGEPVELQRVPLAHQGPVGCPSTYNPDPERPGTTIHCGLYVGHQGAHEGMDGDAQVNWYG